MAQHRALAVPAQIVALHEDVQPAEYLLHEQLCTFGRSPDCQIVIARSVVSRLHTQIQRRGPRYLLEDIGSINGTFVNSKQIRDPHLLKDRDLIGLGAATALLRFLDPDPTVRSGARLRYDERRLVFLIDEQTIDLTPAQFKLLSHLYQHSGEVCTRESCAQAIWGREYNPGLDAGALDRAINNLRGRLRQADAQTEWIQTRRGLGYLLEAL